MRRSCQNQGPRRPGFTLVELLVVVGIIAVLISILIPVISKVKQSAYRADCANQLNSIRGAIEAYYQVFQAYPGPVADTDLMGVSKGYPIDGLLGVGGNAVKFPTAAENLVLGLLGGLERQTNKDSARYNPAAVGGGAVSIERHGAAKKYPAFLNNYDGWLSSRDEPFRDALGQQPCADTSVPEFIDRYPNEGMPILYLRARKGARGIISDQRTGELFQYDQRQIAPYVGDRKPTTINGKVQSAMSAKGVPMGLYELGTMDETKSQQALWYFKNPTLNQGITDPARGVPRNKDGFILISAGQDRIYGTTDDITTFGSVAQ